MSIECIRCKTPLSKDCQLIFDETGIELQLDKLLVEHFGIHIEKDDCTTQALCEECVNKLIELYDITQRNQELESAANEASNAAEEETQEFKEEVELIIEEAEVDFENEVEDVDENTLEPDHEYEEVDMKNQLVAVENNEEFFELDNEVSFGNIQTLDELEGITTQQYCQKAIKSELEEIDFDQTTVCRLCEEVLKSHTAVMMHIATNHETDSKQYPCIVCNVECFHSIKDVAHHIVLKHYDLEAITIYCICPECDKRFSNFSLYNKHSCHKASTGNRLLQECFECSRQFNSNKRYRFHLQFHLEKRRPKACFICDILFSDENDFYEHIMYAHEKKDKLICKKCDRICSSQELYDNHIKVHDAVRTFYCEYCTRSYLYKQMLTNHIKRQHTEKDCYQCTVCKKSLASKHVLARHMKLIHNEQTEESVCKCSTCGLVAASKNQMKEHIGENICSDGKLTTECLTVAFACEFCEQAYCSVENLKLHRKIHVKKRYSCWICKTAYSEFKKLKTHILTHNNVEPLQDTFPINRHYVCDFNLCNQTYLTWPSLSAHKLRHSINAKFTCEICDQTFRTQTLLNNHQRGHDNNDQFPCQFCPKICSSQMSLAVHVARKHNNNCKTCPTCNSTYPTEEALKDHIDKYHVELECKQCGKVTKNKRNLDTHIRMVHANVKRYFCSTCNKGYYNNGDLKIHERAVHSDQHKFKCQHCDFTTSYEASYNAHLLLHESKKPFKCDICSKEFTRKTCFKLHLLRHSDVKPFACPVEDCDRSFVTRGILNTHLRDSHPEAESKVKRASPRPVKRRQLKAAQPVRNTKPRKYLIVDESSCSAPLELDDDEGGVIFYDASNADQEIVLECIEEDNYSIEDLNHCDVVN